MADQTEQEQMLSIIQNRVERASHGKWTACRMTHAERGDDLTPEELGEYVMNSVRKSAEACGSSTFLFISVEKADGQPADVCHVGNGPTSPQNADFIQHAPDDVRYLLALLRERDAQVARLSAQVEELKQEQERAIAEVCAFSREQGIEAASDYATLRAERDAAQHELNALGMAVMQMVVPAVSQAAIVGPSFTSAEILRHVGILTVEHAKAQQQIATLTAALSSIANSSCCGCCQEAALVARAVLGSSGLQDELLDDTARALWHALCEGDGQHSEALDVAIIAAHLQRFAMLTEQQRETTNRLLRDAADFIDNHGPNAHDTDDERHNNEDCAFCQAKGIVGGIRSVLLDAALQSTRPQEQP